MLTIWITGASSGIGEACAYRYAAEGARIILTSSSAECLAVVARKCKELGAGDTVVLPYDLTCLDNIDALTDKAWGASGGGIDIVMLNAGISQRTNVEDTSMEMIRKIMEINYFAPVAIAKRLLSKMIARGGGKIAVTTSIAGRFGFPLRCGYSSSKFALYGFFETLQAEYYDKGIRVTIVCPGRVCTNISKYALDKGGKPHGVMDPGQVSGMPTYVAARIITKAIAKEKKEVLVGRKELLMVYIKRFFPRLCAYLSRRIKPM